MGVFTRRRRRRRLHRGGSARNKPFPAPAPPPPAPFPTDRLRCGTLRQLSQFDPSSLAWLRDAPALAALQGEKDEEEGREEDVSDAEFWARVKNAGFPPERNLCTLECTDALIFFQTMEVWGVDLDDAPDAFLRLIFSGKQDPAFRVIAESTSGPGERVVRHKMLDANTRFAELMVVWGSKLSVAWRVRTAIVVGHPRFDRYAEETCSLPELVAASQTFAAAGGGDGALDLELAQDAVAADRLAWLKLLLAAATRRTRSAPVLLPLLQCAVEQQSDACLTWLVETVREEENGERQTWMDLRTSAAVYGSDTALNLIDAKYKEKFGTEPEDIDDPDESDWMVEYNTPLSDAALDGNAARMKLLVQLGCPVDDFVASFAVASGDEATMAYSRELVPRDAALEQLEDVGVEVLGSVFDSAATSSGTVEKQFRVMRRVIQQIKRGARYVRSLHLPLTPELCSAAVEMCLESPEMVVKKGLLAVYGQGMPWPAKDPGWLQETFGRNEFQAHRLPLLKWMHERGLQIDAETEQKLRAVHGNTAVDSVVVNAVRAQRQSKV